MKKQIIAASPQHEKSFRETWKLREDVANDPMWQDAYEYAATHKLYPDELNSIGAVLIRKTKNE